MAPAISVAPPRGVVIMALPLLLAVSCGDVTMVGSDEDARGRGAADAETGADGSADSGPDGAEEEDSGEPVPGSIVLVSQEVTLLLDRLCDLDGDGVADNALADLGSPGADTLAIALNTGFAGSIERGRRTVVHLPRVDDVARPQTADAVAFVYSADDMDEPPNADDDFSGDEPFFIDSNYLDPCGEPRYRLEHFAIDGGEVSVESGTIALSLAELPTELRNVHVAGQIAPRGESGELTVCAFAPAASLGRSTGILPEAESSMLEEMLAGGALFGVPTVPGLSLDVDADGDGLERILLDADGRVETCVDGDLTEIPGADCWQDERIADGVSLVLALSAVGARFGGREPGWEYEVEAGGCPEGPPAESRLGPRRDGESCAPRDERCEPWTTSPCCDPEDRCSGANDHAYRCRGPCDASECDYGERIGVCRGGECHPVAHYPDDVDCEPSSTGCTTEYGVATDTVCRSDGTRIHCYETCEPPTGSCGGSGICVPDPFDERGICMVNEPR